MAELVGLRLACHLVVELLGYGPLGDNDDAESLPHLDPPLDPPVDVPEVEPLLGDEDGVRSPGQSAKEGDPTGIAPHDLQEQNPVVGVAGGVEPI